MQRRLLVPLDGGPLAEAALPLARRLAAELGASLDLVFVVPDQTNAAVPPRAYLDRLAATLGNDGVAVATRLMHGDPGQCIVRAAASEQVAMVVMTTHARSGVRRAVLGSVAEYVFAHAPVPTLVVHGDCARAPQLKTLLAPVGDSCAAPLTTIIALARACAAQVVLLRVVSLEETYVWQWSRGAILAEPQAVVTARQELSNLAARIREAGLSTQERVQIGAPGPTIVAAADAVDADLIVMATHARTGAQRALQGSVADAVVHSTNRPVLLARLIPPPPGQPRTIDIMHALHTRYAAPPPPRMIPGPLDGVQHAHTAPHWGHLEGVPSRPRQ
jgi:nucleotide-binding universal stress UspA family protein